jgi:hypothetical protein
MIKAIWNWLFGPKNSDSADNAAATGNDLVVDFERILHSQDIKPFGVQLFATRYKAYLNHFGKPQSRSWKDHAERTGRNISGVRDLTIDRNGIVHVILWNGFTFNLGGYK